MLAGPARKGIGLVIADVTHRRRRIDPAQAAKRHRKPGAVDLAPIAGRLPALRLDRRPAVRQPQGRRRVAAVGHEFEPFAVGDERRRKPHRPQHDLMRRLFVVEAEAVAVVADRMDAGDQRAARPALRPPRGHCQSRIVGRMGFVEREGVQDVGEQQFLVLLLVIEADLDDRDAASAKSVRAISISARDRGVDMSAIGGDFGGARPRDQAALRARLPRPGRDVIGVEQIGEALVERRDSPARTAAAEIARRTTSHARDATWSGSRPASTGRPDPRPTAARRAARSRRAPRERRCSQIWRGSPDGCRRPRRSAHRAPDRLSEHAWKRRNVALQCPQKAGLMTDFQRLGR